MADENGPKKPVTQSTQPLPEEDRVKTASEQARQNVKPIVNREREAESGPAANQARLNPVTEFRRLVVEAVVKVGENPELMPQARESLTKWYAQLSKEDKKAVANIGRQYLTRMRLVAEGMHQEFFVITQQDI